MSFDTVDARGLTKVYGRQRALAGVDLTLRAGEATALLGPNGAGAALLAELLAEERARGCIMVVVTHDFDAVAPLVDRVVVLARGRIAHDAAAPQPRSTEALADVYRAAVQS